MTLPPLANLAQQERTRRQILHKSDLIPPLPDVVVRVMGLLNKADTEPHELEDHLCVDQVLVAKMLSLVNSPFYGLTRQITTIREAVMVLGFRGLRSLILATSTAKFLGRDYGCYGYAAKGLWQHGLGVAAATRTLARTLHRDQETCEQLFVAGLLHDIGKMLLAPFLQERGLSALTATGSIVELERQHIGMDHTEAGALVAAKWNLAPIVEELIRGHHDGEETGEHAHEVAMLRLADAIALERAECFVAGYQPQPAPIDRPLSLLGITAARWQELRPALDDAMDHALSTMAKVAR